VFCYEQVLLDDVGSPEAEVTFSIFVTRDHLEHAGVDGRIILKLILKKWDRGTD
jgi:hypothetical protein